MILPLKQYRQQRQNARTRGIPFLMTFAEWCGVWERSGQWERRGRGRGKYYMARENDEGPYSVGNVRIIPWEENLKEYHAVAKQVRAMGFETVKEALPAAIHAVKVSRVEDAAPVGGSRGYYQWATGQHSADAYCDPLEILLASETEGKLRPE